MHIYLHFITLTYLFIYPFIYPFMYISTLLHSLSYLISIISFSFITYQILFFQNPSPNESLTRMIIELLVIGGSFFWAYISMIVFIIFNSDDRYFYFY